MFLINLVAIYSVSLFQIVLKGNPLGYHKQYRNIVCTILGIKLASKVM